MKQTNCKTCGKKYTPMCDYMQGRCPYHSALISTNKIKTRLHNLINFLRGK
jgi:hypothetical protein